MTERALGFGSIPLPTHWQEQTVYQFFAPVQAQATIPLVAGKGVTVEGSRAACSVSLVSKSSPAELATYVARLLADLEKTQSGFESVAEEPWVHPILGRSMTFSWTHTTPGGNRREVIVFLKLSPEQYAGFLFGAPQAQFETERLNFRKLFEGFRPA